ncbi:MAG: Rrf2 family transcriptional regulator, partial [Oscillospiraceae bacterium]
MHITLESDYAVRIVDALACCGKRMDAKTIADQTGVTLRFSLKILHKLVACGIVRSYKGAKGGYELARPAAEISLRDVIETVEGLYTFSRCLNPEHVCKCDAAVCRSGSCRFQKAYDEISEIVREKLNQMTF